jgi:hypothetical protein
MELHTKPFIITSNMKKFLLLFMIAITVTCCSMKRDAYITVYKWEGFGELPSEYIVIKPHKQLLESFDSNRGGYGALYKYTINNDTLYLNLQYSYDSDNIYKADSSSIYPRKLLILKNSIIDITDYEKIDPLYSGNAQKYIYKRIK